MAAILGISAFYHDSAAALIVDGEIVAAAQEERFTRIKHDASFPKHAVDYCLSEAGITAAELDHVGFYDKPYRTFERLLETYLAVTPRGLRQFYRAMPPWLGEKLHIPSRIKRALGGDYTKRLVFCEHHQSHAASAFFPSPFEKAAILTVDGVGEWATATFGTGSGKRINLQEEMYFPHSLGLLYSAFTQYCGFKVNSGEYKLMGLAPYGEPRFADQIRESVVDLKADGSFRLDMRYFDYCAGLTMTSPALHRLFGRPPRTPETEIDAFYKDIAASIQQVTEEIMLRCARYVHQRTGMKNLCLAGGVALNCVANGRLLRECPFERIWIQPAANDAGGALGVAQLIWYQLLGNDRNCSNPDSQHGSLLGPAFSSDEFEEVLNASNASFQRIADLSERAEWIAERLQRGQVVGHFAGRMEFGPRALGNRSILGDPRDPGMQRTINLKVKFRESFRPFAPAVLRDKATKEFDLQPDQESPYMLLVTQAKNANHPAITHVDGSARVQTVSESSNPAFAEIITAFHRRTQCPMVINTSFNVRGEPVVCSPADALRCFMATDIDALVLEDFVLDKSDQNALELQQPPPVHVPRRKRLLRAWMKLVAPIGWLISHILMTLVFVLVFIPVGLIMKIVRYDALQRRLDPEAASHWRTIPPDNDPKSPFRQF